MKTLALFTAAAALAFFPGCAGTGTGGKVTPADVGQTVENVDKAAKIAAEILTLSEKVARDYKEIRALDKK